MASAALDFLEGQKPLLLPSPGRALIQEARAARARQQAESAIRRDSEGMVAAWRIRESSHQPAIIGKAEEEAMRTKLRPPSPNFLVLSGI